MPDTTKPAFNQTAYDDLIDQVNRHNKLYYENDAPEISDYEYDQLTQALKAMEAAYPDHVRPDSPTQHVNGKAASAGKKVTHPVQLLSLNDVFDYPSVRNWYESYGCPGTSVQDKIDGLTISLEYRDGRFFRGATRGDGFIGEDVTENARNIKGIPMVLPIPANAGVNKKNRIFVRAEVYMPVADFERVNKSIVDGGGEPYANPRNCAAGSLRVGNPEITRQRGLAAFSFCILKTEGWENCDPAVLPRPGLSETGDLELLKALGFDVVTAYSAEGIDEILACIDRIAARRETLPYWIDGAVVKIDDKSLQADIGVTAKCPKHAVAYKYPPEKKVSTVRDIIVQTGRTGMLTPVAVVDPVPLCGTTVTRATLHNQKFIDEMGIGVGAEIEIIKSGEIIPRVVGVKTKPSVPFRIERCPVCGSKAVEGTDADGTPTGVYYCPNLSCPAQASRYIQFFCSRDVMDVEGVGPALANQLFAAGLARTPADLYRLNERRDEIAALPGMGDTSTDKLLAAIEKSKTRDMPFVIKALGIPGVGRHVGKALAAKYPDIDAVAALSVDDLMAIDGIGEITAADIYRYFHEPESMARYQELKSLGVNVKSGSYGKSSEGPLSGMTFVITGTLPTRSRDEAKALIEANGGKCSGSVSRKTTYVLAGEAAGGKLTKALDLGIPVISEADLEAMI